MKKIIFPVLSLILFVSAGRAVHAEDLSDLLGILQENIFSVNIIARVYDSGEVSSWNMEVTKYTISGKKISVRLQGENIRVIADITPYIEDDGVLLLAQGQVWVNTPGDKTVKYSSTMKSLPIQLGDKVFFYPLGIGTKENEKMFILELEIQVLPYKNVAQKENE